MIVDCFIFADGMYRIPEKDTEIPKILVQPISAKIASTLLR